MTRVLTRYLEQTASAQTPTAVSVASPVSRWVFGNVDMRAASALMSQPDELEQHAAGGCVPFAWIDEIETMR